MPVPSTNKPIVLPDFEVMQVVIRLTIMPGVLIIEALSQTGGILALKAMGGGQRIAYFAGPEGCKFRRPVVPGDQLRLEVTVNARKGPVWKMHGEALVDGALVAKGDLTATIPDKVEASAGGGEE